ncbi:MAG: tetratricopeptide repeat protein [Myxococcota bacterium]
MRNHPIAAFVTLVVLVGAFASLVMTGLNNAKEPTRTMEDPAERLRRQLQIGIALAEAERFESAEIFLFELAQKHPNVSAVWHNYGLVLYASRDLRKAQRAFQKARALDPDNWDAVAEMANLSKIDGDLDGALDLLESIPPGEGRVGTRLRLDPLWRDVASERIRKLKEKHDVVEGTSLRGQQLLEKGIGRH